MREPQARIVIVAKLSSGQETFSDNCMYIPAISSIMVWRSDVSGRLAIMGTMGCRLTAASSAKEANWLFKAAANDAIVSSKTPAEARQMLQEDLHTELEVAPRQALTGWFPLQVLGTGGGLGT